MAAAESLSAAPDGEAQDGGYRKVDPGERSKLSDRPVYEKLELEPKGSTASVASGFSGLSASGAPRYPRRGSTNAAGRKVSAPSALRKLSASAYGGRRQTVQARSEHGLADDDSDDDLSSQIPSVNLRKGTIRAELRKWEASQKSEYRGSENDNDGHQYD